MICFCVDKEDYITYSQVKWELIAWKFNASVLKQWSLSGICWVENIQTQTEKTKNPRSKCCYQKWRRSYYSKRSFDFEDSANDGALKGGLIGAFAWTAMDRQIVITEFGSLQHRLLEAMLLNCPRRFNRPSFSEVVGMVKHSCRFSSKKVMTVLMWL